MRLETLNPMGWSVFHQLPMGFEIFKFFDFLAQKASPPPPPTPNLGGFAGELRQTKGIFGLSKKSKTCGERIFEKFAILKIRDFLAISALGTAKIGQNGQNRDF